MWKNATLVQSLRNPQVSPTLCLTFGKAVVLVCLFAFYISSYPGFGGSTCKINTWMFKAKHWLCLSLFVNSMAIKLYEDQTVLIFYTVLPGMNAGSLKCYVMSLFKNQKLPKWSQRRNNAIPGRFKHGDLSVLDFQWLNGWNTEILNCVLIFISHINC